MLSFVACKTIIALHASVRFIQKVTAVMPSYLWGSSACGPRLPNTRFRKLRNGNLAPASAGPGDLVKKIHSPCLPNTRFRKSRKGNPVSSIIRVACPLRPRSHHPSTPYRLSMVRVALKDGYLLQAFHNLCYRISFPSVSAESCLIRQSRTASLCEV